MSRPISPRLARQRLLLASAALLLLVVVAATAEAPRARWAVWAIVALGALQTAREGRRYWMLTRRDAAAPRSADAPTFDAPKQER